MTNSKYSVDEIIRTIIYVLKTGISFRNIASKIKWRTVYFHFNRFIKANIFERLFKRIRKKYTKNKKLKIIMIDSSFIANKYKSFGRVHKSKICYGINKIKRNKYYSNKNGNKVSIITDKYGLPLSVLINKGTIHDISFVKKHIKDLHIKSSYNKILLADKGYYSKQLRDDILQSKITLCVPPKKGLKNSLFFDKAIYKNRIFVEHCFQKIKTFRRCSFRYDKKFSSFKQNIFLTCSLILINKL